MQTLHMICNLVYHLVPFGKLPAWIHRITAWLGFEVTSGDHVVRLNLLSVPLVLVTKGKSWRQNPLTSSSHEWCHPFSLKSSNFFRVAPQTFRKAASSRRFSSSSLGWSQPLSIHTADFQALGSWLTSLAQFAKLFSAMPASLMEKIRHKANVTFPKSALSRAEQVTAQLLRPKARFWLAKHHLPSSLFALSNFPTVYL